MGKILNIDSLKKPEDFFNHAFDCAAFGLNQETLIALNSALIERFENEDSFCISHKLKTAWRHGEIANDLNEKMKIKIKRKDKKKDIDEWVLKVSKDLSRVEIYLKNNLEKSYEKKSINYVIKRSSEKETTLQKIKLNEDGFHPNSLRHLKPASQWDILIDEAGSIFSQNAKSINDFDVTLGRVIALVLPQDIKLNRLNNFHAREATPKQVDNVLKSLLEKRVGIFGFTVNDPVAFGNSWINHVYHLMRWVLYLLPIRTDCSSSVRFFIEQRAEYDAKTDLSLLIDILQDELRSIDPQRFGKLTISKMEFISKSGHFANGYVDAVAFTWGSPTEASKSRLKNSELLGHCLLHPGDEQVLERLYLAINAHGRLTRSEWYQLCAVAVKEGESGLMHNFLERWGEKVKNDPDLWNDCLQEARYRLQIKDYQLNELGAALDWLEKWKPSNKKLSKPMYLQLEMTKMANENHLGHFNLKRVNTCLDLSWELHEEMAVDACETDLRIAVMLTNNFAFSNARLAVKRWLDQPVAVAGLRNTGKLYSTLGQLCAFEHDFDEAIAHFDHALALFARLSDPEQAEKEAAQTQIYRLIALMDHPHIIPDVLPRELGTHLFKTTGEHTLIDVARTLASCAKPTQRFTHHLFLRALLGYPEAFSVERGVYLQQAQAWQCREDYPWTHIEAYRAWLWVLENEPKKALEHMNIAIALSERRAYGPIMHWIAEVLRTLAQALNLQTHKPPSKEERMRLQKMLSMAPHAALAEFSRLEPHSSHARIRAAMQQCLPFNFC